MYSIFITCSKPFQYLMFNERQEGMNMYCFYFIHSQSAGVNFSQIHFKKALQKETKYMPFFNLSKSYSAQLIVYLHRRVKDEFVALKITNCSHKDFVSC